MVDDDGEDECPLRIGDRISVKKISGMEEFYGIIIELRRGRKKYAHPLCDLEVINKDSPNYRIVDDYCVWCANK